LYNKLSKFLLDEPYLTLYRMELLQSNKSIIGNTIYASTKWYDNRCDQLLSNTVDAEPVQKVRRHSLNRNQWNFIDFSAILI